MCSCHISSHGRSQGFRGEDNSLASSAQMGLPTGTASSCRHCINKKSLLACKCCPHVWRDNWVHKILAMGEQQLCGLVPQVVELVPNAPRARRVTLLPFRIPYQPSRLSKILVQKGASEQCGQCSAAFFPPSKPGNQVASLANSHLSYLQVQAYTAAAFGTSAVWNVTHVPGAGPNVFYFTNQARQTCAQAGLLDAEACGTNVVDLTTVDAGTGRQQWSLVAVGPANTYNILAGGRSACNPYLSTTVCASGPIFDLYYEDDGSGRQQWSLTPYTAPAGR